MIAPLPIRESDSRRYANPERRSIAQVGEDARSVRTERHYDKSARSNRSQERQDYQSVRSQQSGRSQGKSANSSHDFNKYTRLTNSNVSQPDNLVCDKCINHKAHDDKIRNLQNLKDLDKEHANRVNENLRKQLEDEKRKHLEKLKLYQDAIDNQKADLDRKKELDKQADALEKEKIKIALAKNDDLIALAQQDFERKANFINELRDQIKQDEENKKQKALDQADYDKKNPNLLIDDAWREPHRRLLRDHYKDGLQGQIEDKANDKQNKQNQKKDEDEKYRDELAALKNKDDLEKKAITAQKKEILLNELAEQQKERALIKDLENQIKKAEDDNHKRKIQHDNDVYLDNLFRKKLLNEACLQKVTEQKDALDLKKKLDREEARKPGLTSVPIPQKDTKRYNCKVCDHQYPINQMNRKKKI